MSTLRDLSRCEYSANDTIPNRDELKLGALQRIADATEAMAKRHTELIRERDSFMRLYHAACERETKLSHSNAALRGQITRLRKKLAARDAGVPVC